MLLKAFNAALVLANTRTRALLFLTYALAGSAAVVHATADLIADVEAVRTHGAVAVEGQERLAALGHQLRRQLRGCAHACGGKGAWG